MNGSVQNNWPLYVMDRLSLWTGSGQCKLIGSHSGLLKMTVMYRWPLWTSGRYGRFYCICKLVLKGNMSASAQICVRAWMAYVSDVWTFKLKTLLKAVVSLPGGPTKLLWCAKPVSQVTKQNIGNKIYFVINHFLNAFVKRVMDWWIISRTFLFDHDHSLLLLKLY